MSASITRQFAPHLERLRTVVVSNDGRWLAYGGFRETDTVTASTVQICSTTERTVLASIPVPSAVTALCALTDQWLLAAGDDGVVYGLSVEPGIAAQRWAALGSPITAVASTAHGRTVVATTDAGEVVVLAGQMDSDPPQLTLVGRRRMSPRPLRAVALDPEGHRIVAAGDDSIVRMLPVATLDTASVRTMPGAEGGVFALVVTDDGRVIAGAGDGSIRIDFLDGAIDQELRSGDDGHAGPVRGLVLRVGPSRRLFSVGDDGRLKSWPLDTRRQPKNLVLGTAALTSIAWRPTTPRDPSTSPNGQLIITDHGRGLSMVGLGPNYELAETIERIDGRLAQLCDELEARSIKARAAALEALGGLAEQEARHQLDRVLRQDKAPHLRARAAELLGQTQRHRSRPALRDALDDPQSEVRQAALSALTELEVETPLALARAALASTHAPIRIEGLRRLPPLRDRHPLVPTMIAERLRDAEASVRIAALDGLEALEPEGSLEPARIAFARGPADIRVQILMRLSQRASDRSRSEEGYALIEQALDDTEAEVRRIAFVTAVAGRPALCAALRRADPSLDRSIASLNIDGRLSASAVPTALDDDARAPLFAAVVCRHTDTALRGARALGVLGDPRATGALLQLSREPEAAIRIEVVAALLATATIMSSDQRLRTRLRWMLDDPSDSVRTAAYDALFTLATPQGDVGLVALTEVALRCGHASIRRRALHLLVELGPDRPTAIRQAADELLGHALDDEDASVRNDAYRTLWAWYEASPPPVLKRASQSRHADIREQVAHALDRQSGAWSDHLLRELVGDSVAQVALTAYRALTASTSNPARAEQGASDDTLHRAAMASPRPEVRAAGCVGAMKGSEALRARLVQLLDDPSPRVHIAAIEALDHLTPHDQAAFATAFSSPHWGLQVRAGELCGQRRDRRACGPMQALLAIPPQPLGRPSDTLRQRAARAMADVGDPNSMPSYVTMLDDEDPVVREMGARGLAGAVTPGRERPLISALCHPDLSVRSWVAEGLARLGDTRAVPVLAGTLSHEHHPIRLGAILSFVALGPDGISGILGGLEDPDREIQDLVFAVVVARDLALARAGLGPDLLLTAVASSHPEIRLVAARALEARQSDGALSPLAHQLVGPHPPSRAADLDKWPAERERGPLLNVLVAVLASDDPTQRYAAARILSLRPQPEAFWRELQRLRTPKPAGQPDAPATNWQPERREPRRRGWIRRLLEQVPQEHPVGPTPRVDTITHFAEASEPPPGFASAEAPIDRDIVLQLVFGTYVGLIRHAPTPKAADTTHRVRRDALGRLGPLSRHPAVGRAAVFAVARRALHDPHHLVRKAAFATLRSLCDPSDTTPLGLAMQSSAADIGRVAVDELVAMAQDGHAAARTLALSAVDAPNSEVRRYAVSIIQRLFEPGALDPWLVALGSRDPNVRLSVVDRLSEAQDPRVDDALARALESDHDDLRLRAAEALAARGQTRPIDVLGALLDHDDGSVATRALRALVTLAHAPTEPSEAKAARHVVARTVAARLDDHANPSPDPIALIDALAGIGDPAGDAGLLPQLHHEKSPIRRRAFDALMILARHPTEGPRPLPGGNTRLRYHDALALRYIAHAAQSTDLALRRSAVQALRDIDDPGAEAWLARLIDDREPEIRIVACEAQVFRVEHVPDASIELLVAVLRSGRRELVVPAASGLAGRRHSEALLSLLLGLNAGEPAERERALRALGTLGDPRALADIEAFVEPDLTLTDDERALAPTALEALGRMLPHLDDPPTHARIRERVERAAREGPVSLRSPALTGLRHAGDERSRRVLEAAALDRWEQIPIRNHAIGLLGALAHPDTERVLTDLIDDPSRPVRHTAHQALGQYFADQPTHANLIALGSQYSDLWAPAARVVARHGDPAILVERMAQIDRPDIRRLLRQGLIRRGAYPIASIKRLLRGESDGPRADAAWLAGASGDPSLRPDVDQAALRSATAWPQHQRRGSATAAQRRALVDAWQACLWASRQLGGAGRAAARLALDDSATPAVVRQEALRLLAHHGDAEDIARARPALADPNPQIRRAAAMMVSTLAPDQAADLLQTQTVADTAALAPVAAAALDHGVEPLFASEQVRAVVLPAVLQSRPIDSLLTIAHSAASTPARLTAIGALGRVGGDPAKRALELICARDTEPVPIRQASFRALRRLQRRRARPQALAATPPD